MAGNGAEKAMSNVDPVQVPLGSKAKRDRSPNYPSITFAEAVEKTKTLWDKDKKHPMSADTAARHLGYTNGKNGAFQTTISALRKYGLVENADGDVRVSEDASLLFIYPSNAPERVAVARKLAMRPAIFGQVLQEFPGGLPSDENLRAKLQHKWGFASQEAADVFIRSLRNALEVAPVDSAAPATENSAKGEEPEDDAMPLVPPAAPATGVGANPNSGQAKPTTEKHTWKLGAGVWADITITGKLDSKSFEKLQKYVELIDVSEDVDA